MALTVEDGTVVANADSYISVADSDTYFANHGDPAAWVAATTAQKEAALRYSTIWLDSKYKWFSDILSSSQVLGWPRVAYTDSEGRSIGGSGVMPQRLLNACCEMALEYIENPFTISDQKIIRERVGSAEVEYAGSGSGRDYGFVRTMLFELGIPKSMAGKVIRG